MSADIRWFALCYAINAHAAYTSYSQINRPTIYFWIYTLADAWTECSVGSVDGSWTWNRNILANDPVNTGSHHSHRYQIKIVFIFNFPSTSPNTLNLFSGYIKIDFNLFFVSVEGEEKMGETHNRRRARDNRCLKQVNIFQLHAAAMSRASKEKLLRFVCDVLRVFFSGVSSPNQRQNRDAARAFQTNRLCRTHYSDFIAFVAFIMHWLLGAKYGYKTIRWLDSHKLVSAIRRRWMP